MIERKILIGLITSTEFCQRLRGLWNIELLESDMAKRLSVWIWEYYDKYGKAPGPDMEILYFSKLKESRLPRSVAEEIEQDILPNLSDEFAKEGLDVKPLLDETERYFNERHFTILSQQIQDLVSAGKINEAEHMVRDFRPLISEDVRLNDHILTIRGMRKKGRKAPKPLLSPWLREGEMTVIYGNFGTGKSLLTISAAYILGLEAYDSEDAEIGEWQVKHPTGCLYIDGELGEVEMLKRIAQFEWLGRQNYPIRVLSIPEYQLETRDTFILSERKNQLKIVNWLKTHPQYRLVVLDSASTLFGLEDENNNSEWNNKINPLLRDLRGLGVACLLLHHAGKDGSKGFRGASAIGAMAENIFRITNHKKKNVDDGEAWFIISKDKLRSAGKSFKKFALKYTQTDDGKSTQWEETELE